MTGFEMKSIMNGFKVAMLIVVAWSVVGGVKPFWQKYWLEREIESAAIYGTKNSLDDTREFLDRKMREKGYAFQGEDFEIDRDAYNNISLSITYVDEINVLGITLKELAFTVKTRATETEAYF